MRILPALLALLALAACSDDFGEPCDMPNTAEFEALCDESIVNDTETSATCLFTNNAQCSTRICARFQGSRDYCSESCDASAADGGNSQCPGTAECRTAADGTGFCVPVDVLESVDVAENEGSG